MVQVRSQPDQASVEAQITYGKPPPAGQEEYFYVYKVPDGQKDTNPEAEQFTMPVTDMRKVKPFTLTRIGFQLERLPSPAEVQWDEDEQIRPHICSASTCLQLWWTPSGSLLT